MKRVIVSFQAKLADVYDDSSFPDPTAERIEKTIVWHLRRCMSDKGGVVIHGVKISYEVVTNAND